MTSTLLQPEQPAEEFRGCTWHPSVSSGCKGHPAVCHENNNDQCSCLQTIPQDFQFLNEQNLLSEFGSFPLPSAFKQNFTLKLFGKKKK